MMLHRFLTATATADEQELRRAMAAALAMEIPHEQAGYGRFYRRVVDQIDAARKDPRHVVSARIGGRLTSAA
ncbi:MAG: hypothetical protein QF681_16590 [Vicinamibacterales bacterium]|jgi:hypothetical protein|nr:hypothetical protein [Vicinamibacterales bacterium]